MEIVFAILYKTDKKLIRPWPVWLSWLECHPVTQGLQVRFPVKHIPRLHIQSLFRCVQSPIWACVRGKWLRFLSLSLLKAMKKCPQGRGKKIKLVLVHAKRNFQKIHLWWYDSHFNICTHKVRMPLGHLWYLKKHIQTKKALKEKMDKSWGFLATECLRQRNTFQIF